MQVDVFVMNYNGERFLQQTLESVMSMENPGARFIFSDNGSKDSSVAIARRFEERGLEVRERKGTGDAYSHANLCVEEATAPLVALLHADDLFDPDFLAKQVAFLESHPEFDAAMTEAIAIDENGRELWPIRAPFDVLSNSGLRPQETYLEILRHGCAFLLWPATVFRTDCFKRLGMFRSEFPSSGDLEIFLRILLRGRGLGYLSEPLMKYRLSAGQGGGELRRGRTGLSDFFTVVELYLSHVKVSESDLSKFEAIRRADLLQSGLNLLVQRNDLSLLREQVSWWKNHRLSAKGLGGVDRIKISLCLSMSSLLFSARFGARTAKWITYQTDVRTGGFLQLVLRMKRRFA